MKNDEILSKLIASFGIERVRDYAEVEAKKSELIGPDEPNSVTEYLFWKGAKEHLDNQINKQLKY